MYLMYNEDIGEPHLDEGRVTCHGFIVPMSSPMEEPQRETMRPCSVCRTIEQVKQDAQNLQENQAKSAQPIYTLMQPAIDVGWKAMPTNC